MDIKLIEYISDKYGIVNPDNCTKEEADKVLEIFCNDKGIKTLNGLENFKNLEIIKLPNNNIIDFDLNLFPKLKKLDCSLNPIENINLSQNSLLEEICYYGLRGNKIKDIDFSGNPKLKKIEGGQEQIKQLDFNNNYELEEIDINLSSYLRFINLKNCAALKRIKLMGVLIPYIDLTHNNNLEKIEISYLNVFKRSEDEYGDGFPKPIIFVNENFNENLKNNQNGIYEYSKCMFITVKKESKEEAALKKLEGLKDMIINIPEDFKSEKIARFHYEIIEILK